MDFFDKLFKAFTEHPAGAVATLLVIAAGFIFKENLRLNGELLKLALSTAPVAAKLADGVEALERVLDKVISRKE